jgi:hypothetical protein
MSSPVTGTKISHSSLELVPVHKPEQNSIVVTPIQPSPHTEFPKFDGKIRPRVWQKACEKYFRLFAVSDSQWVEYATLHFTGNVATWLQTVDDQLPTFTWGGYKQ